MIDTNQKIISTGLKIFAVVDRLTNNGTISKLVGRLTLAALYCGAFIAIVCPFCLDTKGPPTTKSRQEKIKANKIPPGS